MTIITNILISRNIKILCLIFLLFFQGSCGFNPAYRVSNTDNVHLLSSIEITPITTIEGASFYDHIKSIFPPEKNTRYILNTSLFFSRTYNIIQSNADILREVQNIKVTYQLIDKEFSKILTEGSFTKMSSYNVNSLLYSNTVLREEAISDLAENAAEEVRNRLLMFFAKEKIL